MRKFTRINTKTGEELTMVACKGTIKTIADKPKANSNGNEYHIFTAEVEGPRGPLNIMGQVYSKAFDFLGGKPEPGKEFSFASNVEDLKAKNNKLWSIAGTEVDEISDDFLADLDQLA